MNKRLLQSYPDYYFYNEDQPPTDGSSTPTKEGYKTKYYPVPPNLQIPDITDNGVIYIWYLADNLSYPAFNSDGKLNVSYKGETFALDYNDEVIVERDFEGVEEVESKHPKNAEEFDVTPLTDAMKAAEQMFQIPS